MSSSLAFSTVNQRGGLIYGPAALCAAPLHAVPAMSGKDVSRVLMKGVVALVVPRFPRVAFLRVLDFRDLETEMIFSCCCCCHCFWSDPRSVFVLSLSLSPGCDGKMFWWQRFPRRSGEWHTAVRVSSDYTFYFLSDILYCICLLGFLSLLSYSDAFLTVIVEYKWVLLIWQFYSRL